MPRRIQFTDDDDRGDVADIYDELVEALTPGNARKFDGDPNFKKCIDIKVSVVGDEKGAPWFLLEAKSPRSCVNNLGCSVRWGTNSKEKAVAFLRELAERIEKL